MQHVQSEAPRVEPNVLKVTLFSKVLRGSLTKRETRFSKKRRRASTCTSRRYAPGQDPANAGTTVQVCMDIAGVVITCAVCSVVFGTLGAAGGAAMADASAAAVAIGGG